MLGLVDLGRDPLAEQLRVSTFRALVDRYFAREASKIRTSDRRRDIFERLVFPVIGGMPVEDIKRSEIIRMLDKIEDDNGPERLIRRWPTRAGFSPGTKSDTTTLGRPSAR